MYVTTFYSFKGGVGRTMALVNVAVELAQRGRRVLAVDFDLEAPGIDTFELPSQAGTTPGVIDFVNTYLSTGQAPHVGDFVFESPHMGTANGALWIMPAGARQDSYASTLAQIDWGALYEQHDGYLLFEDLKEQWSEFVNPDYVLIDSRTGHTDIAGICTRQLPNSVVILFFPNAQNLLGLTKVVRDIRAEARHPRYKAIDLHFVMSNVPDLDDEDQILEENIISFQQDLGFQRDPMVIHRYDSLSLLNQVIFTRERPRSRLASEYRELTSAIMRLNFEDRDGALDYISRIQRISRTPGSRPSSLANVEAHLETIEESLSGDGEVLFRLGSLRADEGSLDDADALFTRAIEAGYADPEVYLRRAAANRGVVVTDIRRPDHGDRDRVSRDAIEALNSDHASQAQVRRAIAMVAPDQLKRVPESPALTALPHRERVTIAKALLRSTVEAETASAILRPVFDAPQLPTEERQEARDALTIASIALRRFSEAIEVIRSDQPDFNKMSIHRAFNYSMALWGDNGKPVTPPFHRVVEIERTDPRQNPGPNYFQCMAITYWATGELHMAHEAAEQARRATRLRRRRELSCWRYLLVQDREFEEDINQILRLIGGDDSIKPLFLT